MGRTYEALVHGRSRREAPDEASVPSTTFLPFVPEHVEPDMSAHADSDPALLGSTADTALGGDKLRDNNDVPYIEVGGPRGSAPTLSPLIAPTSIPNPQPLKLTPVPAPVEQTPPTVAFFPLPEQQPLDVARVSRELVALHRPDHASSAQYRSMLAGIAGQHTGNACPLLVFTSVGQDVDVATIILNLAITRAREEQKRLLVIEANHAQPLLAERMGITSLPGLRELLRRDVPATIALKPTAQPRLYALPPGDPDLPVPQDAEARLPEVINHLRKRFDWLLVNAPEWGIDGSSEWLALGDAAYLVVRHDQWEKPEVEAAHQGILTAGAKLRGYMTIR